MSKLISFSSHTPTGLFWQSPKRPPSPIDFSLENDEHMAFVISCARLTANIHGIPVSPQDLTKECIVTAIENTTVPDFAVTNKVSVFCFYLFKKHDCCNCLKADFHII